MVKWSNFDNCVVAEGKQRRLGKTDSQIHSGNEECVHNDPIPETRKELGVVWSTFITQLNRVDGGIQENCVFDKYVLSTWFVPHTVRRWA